MDRPDSSLAVRPDDDDVPLGMRRLVLTRGTHETQYTVAPSILGEAILQWSAFWWAGLFCVNGFPADVIAYVHQMLGPHHLGHWPIEGQEQPVRFVPYLPTGVEMVPALPPGNAPGH